MLLVYLIAIFVICSTTYLIYAIKTKRPTEDNDLNANSDQLSLMKTNNNNYENIKTLMKEPIENINRITDMLNSLKDCYTNIIKKTEAPLNEILNLKSQLVGLSDSVSTSQVNCTELHTLIQRVQNDLQGLRVMNNQDILQKILSLQNAVEGLHSFKLPKTYMDPVESLISSVTTSIHEIKDDIINIQQLIKSIKEIEASNNLIYLNKVTEVLEFNKQIKNEITSLVSTLREVKKTSSPNPTVLSNIEAKVISLSENYSRFFIASEASITKLETLLNNIKLQIESLKQLPVDSIESKINSISENVVTIKSENTKGLKYLQEIKEDHGVLNTIKLDCSLLNEIKLNNIGLKKDIATLITAIDELKNKQFPDLSVLNSIDAKIISLSKNYSNDFNNAIAGINKLENILNGVKLEIKSILQLPVEQLQSKINDISENVITIKSENIKSSNDLQEIKTSHGLLTEINRHCSLINGIKPKIDSINDNSERIPLVKSEIDKMGKTFHELVHYLKSGVISVIKDCVLIVKDAGGKNLTVTIKYGYYNINSLQKTIKDSLDPKTKNDFNLSIVNDRVVIEHSVAFHIDNNLRELLGFNKLEGNNDMFSKKYIAPNKHNLDKVLLETLVHKNSIDAITRKLRSSVNNQISIINRIPNEYQNIIKELDKCKTPKLFVDVDEYFLDKNSKPDMETCINLLTNFANLYRELKGHLKIPDEEEIKLNDITTTLQTEFLNGVSTRFSEELKKYLNIPPTSGINTSEIIRLLEAGFLKIISTTLVNDIKKEALGTLVSQEMFLNQYAILTTAINAELVSLQNKLDATITDLHRQVDIRMNQVETLIMTHLK